MADPSRDGKDDLRSLRQHIQLDQALNDRRILALVSPYQKTEIPLTPLISEATHMRVYGLEVDINGTRLALQLDTGASGILIPHRAADRAGVEKLAEATFGGFGDNLKSPGGYHGIGERLRIGSVEFQDALINVTDQETVGTADGLIGTDVFSQFLITLDFSGQEAAARYTGGLSSFGRRASRPRHLARHAEFCAGVSLRPYAASSDPRE